jgi:hypothetical protein
MVELSEPCTSVDLWAKGSNIGAGSILGKKGVTVLLMTGLGALNDEGGGGSSLLAPPRHNPNSVVVLCADEKRRRE